MSSEKQKMLLGKPHLPSDEQLSALRLATKQLLFRLNTQISPENSQERTALCYQLLGNAGKNLHINPPFFCDYGKHIEVGDNFFANYNCTILDSAPLKLAIM